MCEFSLDYKQYCDLRALIDAEAERRDQISSLWLDQVNECGSFYSKRGAMILKRERDAARALMLKLAAERRAKLKPRELTILEKEYFTRWQLVIEEDESWNRKLIVLEWNCLAHEIVKLFQKCISQHYKFSFDLHRYTEVRRLTAADLSVVKPVDRHLPRNLLLNLKHQKEVKRVEKEKQFEGLKELGQDVSF